MSEMSAEEIEAVKAQHRPEHWAGKTWRCEACARLVDEAGCLPFRLAGVALDSEARVRRLVSALERTEQNFRSAVNGRPVRDMSENLAENFSALNGADR